MPEEIKQLTPEEIHAAGQEEFGLEQEQELREALELPAGSYNTVPKMTLSLTTLEGRLRARFYGPVIGIKPAKLAEGEQDRVTGRKGMVGFTMSSQVVYKAETGNPDNSSKLWSNAVELFRKSYAIPATQAVKRADVWSHIENYPIGIRVTHLPDGAAFVGNLSVPKE